MNAFKLSTGLALLTISQLGWADPLDTWTWRNPLPTGNRLSSVAFGNGRFVAVGYPGTILASADGVHWVPRPAETLNWLYAIAYGSGRFVVVGEKMVVNWAGQTVSDSGITLTSTDGGTWVPDLSDKHVELHGIAYGNGQFVAVGNTGAVLTSSNGTNWVQQQSGSEGFLTSIAYGSGEFVAVGGAIILSSSDGVKWVERRSGAGYWLYGVAYGNGQFVAVGSIASDLSTGSALGDATILTSADGVTWVQRQSGTQNALTGIAYGSGQFLAVGESGNIVTSDNGATWVRRQAGTQNQLYGIAHGNGQFVAVGDLGARLTSADGVNWSQPKAETQSALTSVAYGNGQFVVVGGRPRGVLSNDTLREDTILTSADGGNWVLRQSGTTNLLNSIAFGNGQFVAVGGASSLGLFYPPEQASTILTSADGVTWVQRESGTRSVFSGIAYGNGQFVAVGNNLVTSADGMNWVQRQSGTGSDLNGIAYGQGQFVAVSLDGTTAMSTDGVNWSAHPSGVQRLEGIAYGDGQFVAVGFTCFASGCVGTIVASADGTNWVRRRSAIGDVLSGIAYGSGQFVAVGESGTLVTSLDGVNWISRPSGTLNQLSGTAYGDGRFVAVGDGGTILQSGLIINLMLTRMATRGLVTLSAASPIGLNYTIQTSTDLVSWRNLTNIVGAQASNAIFDALPVTLGHAFYRAFAQ